MYQVNAASFIEKNLMKVKGYDYNWISMISSKPVIFEDVDYLRVMHFINNTITEQELKEYQDGNLRKLYANFEYMLMDNLEYYDRIISFCTMYFHNYISIDGDRTDKYIPKHIIDMDITPTKIWCATMLSTSSTKFEIEYGWNIKCVNLNNGNSPLQNNFHILKRNTFFDTFISYRAFVNNTSGYRETFIVDRTKNKKLYNICKKFTEQSQIFSDNDIEMLSDYTKHVDDSVKNLYSSLDNCMSVLYNNDKSAYAIYVFDDEFMIHTTHFGMRVFKKNGQISKDYMSNSYECFVAEPYLKTSIKKQIQWCKYVTPNKYLHIIEVLVKLLEKLLETDFHEVVAVKRMNTKTGTVSYVRFSGIFDRVYIYEKFMHDNKVVKEYKKCLSKTNAARYIVERGYYIFGMKQDIDQLLNQFENESIPRINILKNHYNRYCVNIEEFMKDVIKRYNNQNSRIINTYINGVKDFNVSNDIKVTSLKSDGDTVNLVIKTVNSNLKNNSKTNDNIKSYYEVIQ
mgnify:CR=1 FL=1